MKTTTQAKHLTVNCQPFTGARWTEAVSVTIIGQAVRVYDNIAGHYTTCHALSAQMMHWLRNSNPVNTSKNGINRDEIKAVKLGEAYPHLCH